MAFSTSTALVFRSDSQDRTLVVCVLLSVLLHAAVLFLSPKFRTGGSASSPRILTATFAVRPASPEPIAAPQVPAEPPQPPREPPKREAKPEAPRPVIAKAAPSPSAVPSPAPVPEPSAPPPVSAAAPAAAPAAAVPHATAPGDASLDALDAGQLEQYRLALIDAAKRYKRYPAQAMERGWQGRVEIRLVIGANGFIKSATVKTSSSYQILDDQALDMVKKGKPFTQIPAALRGKEFTVDVPVIFELRAG